MEVGLVAAARAAIGFMPEHEGLALYEAGLRAGERGPLLEIGSYCGKSAIYLGAAARERGTILYSIDHHRGSEEHQPGEEYHDPRLLDPDGNVDTYPVFRATVGDAGLDTVVIPIVAPSSEIAPNWDMPLGLVFIDGGHSATAAQSDLESWGPMVTEGGLLAIHDVFEDPAEGGRPPFEIYERALASGMFEEAGRTGSLRVLERVGDGVL